MQIKILRFKAASKVACLTAFLLLCSANPFAQSPTPVPPPNGPVNDYAGVIDAETKAALNKRLIAVQRSTGVEIAIAIVRTTGDQDIFDYSVNVSRDWGIGSKGDDNPSLLLFVAVDDRRYFTQVSRDLEDELPDVLAGSLQRQYLVPEFKKGNLGKAVSDTIDAYLAAIQQRSSGTAASPTPVGGTDDEGDSGSLFSIFGCLLILGILVLIVWANQHRPGGKSGRDNDRWGGGFGGGGALPWVIGSVIGSIADSASSSSSSDWGSSGGSGGSDWGGFGGGGDFGGGGAGGSW